MLTLNNYNKIMNYQKNTEIDRFRVCGNENIKQNLTSRLFMRDIHLFVIIIANTI